MGGGDIYRRNSIGKTIYLTIKTDVSALTVNFGFQTFKRDAPMNEHADSPGISRMNGMVSMRSPRLCDVINSVSGNVRLL